MKKTALLSLVMTAAMSACVRMMLRVERRQVIGLFLNITGNKSITCLHDNPLQISKF